jgi:uncharacterized small protein (DUF1192 family)
MTYANADKQREACRKAMQKYRAKIREQKAAGTYIKSDEPPAYMTTDAIMERIDYLKKESDRLVAERSQFKYNSKDYRNLTSYICKLRQRVDRWDRILRERGCEVEANQIKA